jgi:flagellar motor switch protein FliN/FliY
MAGDPSIGDLVDAAAPTAGSPTAETSVFATLEPEAKGARAALVEEALCAVSPGQLDLVFDVPVCLSVELGRTDVSIRDVVNLGRGSIIELDRGPGTPLDVRINGVLIGRGDVVLVNAEKLGLRFVEVMSQIDGLKRLS